MCGQRRGHPSKPLSLRWRHASVVCEELGARLVDVENREERATDAIARLRIELDAILPRLAIATAVAERAGTDETSAPADANAHPDLRAVAQPSMAVVRG